MSNSTERVVASSEDLESTHPRHVQIFKEGKPVRGRAPRQWLCATKPVFARVQQPLGDALEEMEEIHLIMDIRPYWPGDVRIDFTVDGYCITATRGDLQFVEQIPLPANVDMLTKEVRFKNGVLELILPRKRVPAQVCSLEEAN